MSFLFVLIFCSTFGQTPNLRVVVEGVEGSNGQVMIGVFDNPSDFKSRSNPVRAAKVSVKNSGVAYNFLNVPSGSYAIAVFHDANGDGRLNTKTMKIPTEGVGVSGKVPGKLRLPNFEVAAFHLQNDTVISVQIIYPASK